MIMKFLPCSRQLPLPSLQSLKWASSIGSRIAYSATLLLSISTMAQAVTIPDTAQMGQALSARVVGRYSAPPINFVSPSVTGGAVTGNGDMALMVGGAPSALKFYVGKADFFGVLRGAIQPVGSLTLSAPALEGASYSLHQNLGPATITGDFKKGDSGLSITSWVAKSVNNAVIELKNTGSQTLTLSSQIVEGFSGSTGNAATYGETKGATWLHVSPDTIYLELGNRLHNALGPQPFTGKIADFRLFDTALADKALSSLDGVAAPKPLIQWQARGTTDAKIVGGNIGVNVSDAHSGSVELKGDPSSELLLGALPFPEKQFTLSMWINTAKLNGSGCIVAAQIPYILTYGGGYPYPYIRGLSLNLVNGALSATLNQSGGFDKASEKFVADATNKFTATATGEIPVNQWVQVSATYDGNILRIFTNGRQVGATESFPTGTNGMMGWNKMVTHLGDTNVAFDGCAPQGIFMQGIMGGDATNSSQGTLSFTIPPGGEKTLLLAAITDRNATNYFQAAQQQTQAATEKSIAKLFGEHTAWWKNFWSKSFVQIPDQKIQESWYGSLYLMACSSTPLSPPPGLYGNFITTTQPCWQGDYTLDYNFEGPPYSALENNHMELVENYETPLLTQMSRGRATAEYNFGPKNQGIYFYCHLVPSPGWDDDPLSFEGQKTDALFAAVDSAMRWRYTLDKNYAVKVYPYLKGVADFWDSYLVLTNGVYMDYNDAVSESSGNDVNPATTISFLRLVYPVVVQMSEALNCDADHRAKWNDIINRLAPLPIVPASSIPALNALGAPYNSPGVNVIRDSSSGTAFPAPMITLYHDHAIRSSSAGMSCAQAIFPGWSIGLESDPASLKAAWNTIWLASQWFDFNNECTFYPGAACVGYDPDTILENLDVFETLYRYPNYLNDLSMSAAGLHGCSAEMFAVVPATLASMFLQSYQTNIHLFPDWPANQSAAFGNFNACGGFLVSSAITLGKPNYVQIESTAGQPLKLVNPWPGSPVHSVSNIHGTNTVSGKILTIPTKTGEILTFTPSAITKLSAPADLTSATNGTAVGLEWKAVPGAVGYNVKRADSPHGLYLTLASVTSGTGYIDTNAAYRTSYSYVVTALLPGFESANSASTTITSPAGPIVANAFEKQSVSSGSYLGLDSMGPTDWMADGVSGALVALVSPGTSDNRGLSTNPPSLDGSNYAQIFATGAGGKGMVYQDTGLKYKPGTTYTLTAAFGLENGNFATGSSMALYNSDLTPVASRVIKSDDLSLGAFKDVTLQYTGTGSEGGDGDVIIGFKMPATAGNAFFDFDHVRLVVTPPPTEK